MTSYSGSLHQNSLGPRFPRRPTTARRGTTTVEFAMTAPILFAFVFASFELSRANMLVHTASIAATEGARRSIIAGATASECEAVTRAELNALGIRSADIFVNPPTIDENTSQVSIRVDVPLDGNDAYLLPRFVLGKTVSKTVTLQREGKSDTVANEHAQSTDTRNKNGNNGHHGNGNSGNGNSGNGT